ncbi:SigE family RNA polymerase sigma factor [Nonomuraea sp. H19]|uniref:SigE family RNA polymerase sigma factor n=1 Tax=Nonomuraea sp. H19 TaxID=3452206 RepID=UPI003F8B6E2F
MAEARDDGDFARFVRRSRPALRRTAFQLSQDWYEADDLVQRTLIALHRHWDTLEGRDRIGAYARRVMRRLFISDRRTMRWSREVLIGAVPETAFTADPYFLVSERMALIDALAGLGPRQRATLVLRFWEDRSVEDTARVMGNESSTVRSQTARALNALRQALDAPAADATGVDGTAATSDPDSNRI